MKVGGVTVHFLSKTLLLRKWNDSLTSEVEALNKGVHDHGDAVGGSIAQLSKYFIHCFTPFQNFKAQTLSTLIAASPSNGQ